VRISAGMAESSGQDAQNWSVLALFRQEGVFVQSSGVPAVKPSGTGRGAIGRGSMPGACMGVAGGTWYVPGG